MPIAFENVAQRLEQHRIVIDHENSQLRGCLHHRRLWRRHRIVLLRRETQAHRRTLPWSALDLDLRAVTLRGAIDHRESEAGSLFTLGAEERLQAALACVLIHPGAIVDDLNEDPRRLCLRARNRFGGPRPQRDSPAIRQCIGGVQNEIRERLTQLTLDSQDVRQVGGKFADDLNDRALAQGHVRPAGPGQLDDLGHEVVQSHRHERQLRLTLPIEVTHTRYRVGDVTDGLLNGSEEIASPRAEIRLLLEYEFRVQHDRRNGVIDVVGDTTRHLTQSP